MIGEPASHNTALIRRHGNGKRRLPISRAPRTPGIEAVPFQHLALFVSDYIHRAEMIAVKIFRIERNDHAVGRSSPALIACTF